MKLKKIASLMLAGVMAISMLAGCSGNTTDDNKGEIDTTPSSSYTETVLGKASKAVNNMLSVSSSDTLDKAVAVAAANGTLVKAHNTLDVVDKSNDVFLMANKVINDTKWNYPANSVEQWTFSGSTNNNDGTFYTLYVVTAPKTTDWIAGEIADELDTMVTNNNGDENCEYSIRVAYAEMDGSDSDTKNGYLVGVAITVDNTENNH